MYPVVIYTLLKSYHCFSLTMYVVLVYLVKDSGLMICPVHLHSPVLIYVMDVHQITQQ